MLSYFELSLLFRVFDTEVGIQPSLSLGTDAKELLSPRAKLSPLCLSRLGLCLTSTGNSLFMSFCYLNLVVWV